MSPAVSVVMTAYNRETLIGDAIESVLAQRFTDFELIVVDDGSSDGTVAVVRRYLSDPRVRLVQNERNLGDYPNRNHSASLVRGELFKYHDSDDIMYPHCLDVMVDGLRAYPTAAFALTGSRGWFGAPCPMLLSPRLAYQREYIGYGLFHVGPACALFRTRAFAELGGFPNAGVHSDLLFWLRACATVDVVLVANDLFWYRVHAGQELSAPTAKFEAVAIEAERWRAIDAPQSPLTTDEQWIAKRNQAYGIAKRAYEDVRRCEIALAWRRLTRCGMSAADWLRYAGRPRRDGAAGVPSIAARANV